MIAEINDATRAQNLMIALSPILSAVGMLTPWEVPRAVVLSLACGYIGGSFIMAWGAQRGVRDWARRLDEIASRHKLPTISTYSFQRQTTRVLLFLAVQALIDIGFIAWIGTAHSLPRSVALGALDRHPPVRD